MERLTRELVRGGCKLGPKRKEWLLPPAPAPFPLSPEAYALVAVSGASGVVDWGLFSRKLKIDFSRTALSRIPKLVGSNE